MLEPEKFVIRPASDGVDGMSTSKDVNAKQLESLNALKQVSDALGNDLSRAELQTITRLCEAGANPEGLAMAIREIQAARVEGVKK